MRLLTYGSGLVWLDSLLLNFTGSQYDMNIITGLITLTYVMLFIRFTEAVREI